MLTRKSSGGLLGCETTFLRPVGMVGRKVGIWHRSKGLAPCRETATGVGVVRLLRMARVWTYSMAATTWVADSAIRCSLTGSSGSNDLSMSLMAVSWGEGAPTVR